MRLLSISRWVIQCCIAAVVAGAAATGHAGTDPSGQVLVFDIVGGQRPRSADGPLLVLSATGQISVRPPRPGDARITVQLSPAESAALLDAVVTQYGAFDIDGAAIDDALSRAGDGRLRIADASTTSLTLTLDDRHHAVSVTALPQQARRHPEIVPLQRFFRLAGYLQARAAALTAHPHTSAAPD